MDVILDAWKAPFSAESAAKTTPAKIAVVWAVTAFVASTLLVKS